MESAGNTTDHSNYCTDVDHDTQETRNSSGDEIANVNFLYDDIVHVLQMYKMQ